MEEFIKQFVSMTLNGLSSAINEDVEKQHVLHFMLKSITEEYKKLDIQFHYFASWNSNIENSVNFETGEPEYETLVEIAKKAIADVHDYDSDNHCE